MPQPTEVPIADQLQRAAHAVDPTSPFSEALLKRISAQSREQRRPNRVFRPVWAAAVAVMAVALVVAVVGPSQVAAAFSSLLNYLPGVGFVHDADTALYLAEPVRQTQSGVTLTVDQAVADSQGTTVSYHLDGFTANGACVYDVNQLRLPDGKNLLPTGGGVSGAEARITFQALPAGVDRADLLVSANNLPAECAAPADWTLSLAFSPQPGGADLLPVVAAQDLNPVTPAPAAEQAVLPTASAPAQPVESVKAGLELDNLVELGDGYLLTLHTTWENPLWQNVQIDPQAIQVTDAAGNTVTAAPTDDATQDNNFAIQITGKQWQPPFTLTVDRLIVWTNVANGPSFSFDAGSNPQAGQTWPLDETWDVLGQPLHLSSVAVVPNDQVGADPAQSNGYAVTFTAPADLSSFDLAYEGDMPITSWTSQILTRDDGQQAYEVFYPDGLPQGKVTFRLSSAQVSLQGEWSLQWQLP